jgi:2'-deoxynucleoside 5'-phosphate N-hydrolase
MKAYIAASYSNRKTLNEVLQAIKATLEALQIEPVVFVDQYSFTATQEKEMMQEAAAAIDDCDMLIAETSYKEIGIGIEVGYAKAKHKPVIYLRHTGAAHSTTVSGISDFSILYTNSNDIKQQLYIILNSIIKSSL